MERKELKINIQKKINCYLFDAYYLCIILAYDNLYPWFCENYVQLYYNSNKPIDYTNKSEVWLDFYGGWTEPRKILQCNNKGRQYFNGINIIKFIEECIDKNKYVFTYWDEFCIKAFCREEHFVHDIFIYGYDRLQKIFLVIGFDKNHNFKNYCISYQEFEEAFNTGLELTKNVGDKRYFVEISSDFDENYKYQFSIHKFLSGLYDYLHSIDSSCRESNDIELFEHYKLPGNVFGMDIYNELIKYIKKTLIQNADIIDYRPFHTLYEHKNSIYESMAYIIKTNDMEADEILSEYEQVKNDFNYIRMLILKYNAKKSEKLLNEVELLILKGKSKEYDILTSFYNKLNYLYNKE
jgi:hypothetical protein